MGGAGLVLGLATYGYKIMRTLGVKVRFLRLPAAHSNTNTTQRCVTFRTMHIHQHVCDCATDGKAEQFEGLCGGAQRCCSDHFWLEGRSASEHNSLHGRRSDR